MSIGINEIVSSERIKLFGIEKRRCRFDSELTDKNVFDRNYYTENICILECRILAAMELCGCRPFFYEIGKSFCFTFNSSFIINYHFIKFQIMVPHATYQDCKIQKNFPNSIQ